MVRKSSFFRIDEQVFFTMGVACVVALITLAFKFATREVCTAFHISYADSLIAGSVIRFKADMPGGERCSWEFGDGQGKTESGNTTTHIYKVPGYYTLSVMVNGACEETTSIFVTEPVLANYDNLLPKIISPDTVYLGVPAQFTDVSPQATSWEWRFGETGSVDNTRRDASYIFTKAGFARIHLTINGRPELTANKEVVVIDRQAEKAKEYQPKPFIPNPKNDGVQNDVKLDNDPVVQSLSDQKEKQPEPVVTERPKAPVITTPQLEAMLWDAAAGKKTMADFAPYLGDHQDIPVAYDKQQITLSALLKELQSMKTKKIKSISAVPTIDKNTNCILQIAVTVEKKKLFGLL